MDLGDTGAFHQAWEKCIAASHFVGMSSGTSAMCRRTHLIFRSAVVAEAHREHGVSRRVVMKSDHLVSLPFGGPTPQLRLRPKLFDFMSKLQREVSAIKTIMPNYGNEAPVLLKGQNMK
jgi:hypothetical protein